MRHEFNTITIVGLGLLGGSAALAAKAYNPNIHIAGVDKNPNAVQDALEIGAINKGYTDISTLPSLGGLVILATEVGAFGDCLKKLRGKLTAAAVVSDVGSTKAQVVKQAKTILGKAFGNFVPSHPMAGSEQRGIAFARADLFNGATCIVTPSPATSDAALKKVMDFWTSLSMRVVSMSPQKHDRSAARISHLPHMIAGLVMLLAGNDDIDIASSGFRDVTRLASGNPRMWRDIVLTNRKNITIAVEKFQKDLDLLKRLVSEGSGAEIEKFLARAKNRRDTTIAKVIMDRRIGGE